MKHLTLIASAVTIASALMTGSAFAEDSKAEGAKELPKAVADLGIPGAKVDKDLHHRGRQACVRRHDPR